MADMGTFWYGFLAFILCCAVGLTLSWSGGYVIDTIHEKMLDAPGHDSDFATANESNVYWAINMYYLIMYGVPVIGAIIFGQSIVKRVRKDQFTYR